MGNVPVLHYLGMFGFSLIVAIILKLIGLVGTVGAVLGISAIMIVFTVVHENIRIGLVRTAAFAFLIMWSVYAFIWPFVFNLILPVNIQYALESTGFYLSAQMGRILHRPGAKGNLSRQEFCFNEEDRLVGVEIGTRIEQLGLLVRSGDAEAEAMRQVFETAKSKRGLSPSDLSDIQHNLIKVKRTTGSGVGNTLRMTIYSELSKAQQEIEIETMKCLQGVAPAPKLPTQADLPTGNVGWWVLVASFGLIGAALVFGTPSGWVLTKLVGYVLGAICLVLLGIWYFTGYDAELKLASRGLPRNPDPILATCKKVEDIQPGDMGRFCMPLKQGQPKRIVTLSGINTKVCPTVPVDFVYLSISKKPLLKVRIEKPEDFVPFPDGTRYLDITAFKEDGIAEVLIYGTRLADLGKCS